MKVKVQRTRYNNKNKNNKRNQMRALPFQQLKRHVNLFNKSTSLMVNISYPGIIYGYSVSGLYTFTNNSDVRYLAFGTICSAVEFTDFAGSFMNYRIRSCSAIINPLSVNTGTLQLPMLVLSANPENTNVSTNPTNSALIVQDKTHLFNPQSNIIKSVNFTFPSTGLNTNIWYDTTNTSPSGLFSIGNNSTINWFGGGNVAVFEYMIALQIEFANPK